VRQVRVTKPAKRRQQDDQAPDALPPRSAARPAHTDLLSRIHDLIRNDAA
jgi:hypothetical protein